MEVISSGRLDKRLEEQAESYGGQRLTHCFLLTGTLLLSSFWHLTPGESDQENKKWRDDYSEELYYVVQETLRWFWDYEVVQGFEKHVRQWAVVQSVPASHWDSAASRPAAVQAASPGAAGSAPAQPFLGGNTGGGGNIHFCAVINKSEFKKKWNSSKGNPITNSVILECY